MTNKRKTTTLLVIIGGTCLGACGSTPSSSSSSLNAGGSGSSGTPPAAAGSSPGGSGPSSSSSGATSSGGSISVSGTGGISATGGASSAGAGSAAAAAGNAAGGSAAGGSANPTCAGNATYKVTVSVTWNDAGVDGKHYTTVVGGVHSGGVSLWKLGGLATEGVKEMAEMGGTSVLSTEVNAAIAAGTAKAVIQFGGGNAPGVSIGMVEVSPNFPLMSFGSMIAPSPDWFVGVSALNLCDSGAWLSTKTMNAVVYDAGTKDGTDFDYGYPETQPPMPIGYSAKFPNMASAGTITFEKQ
jgi:hypothetical protein